MTQLDEPRPDGATAEWAPSACILCECNCGIEVRLGGSTGRSFVRIRGDKAHPASQGYTCEKALRLDHYQNVGERLTSPMRRRADGTYESVDWDTAVREVAEGLARVRDTHGGHTIFMYGGGGQGNHLGAARLRRSLPQQRVGPGEDRRILGEREDVRRLDAW
jgi:anaerobic selenocysteine-containing dehydrogenase